MHQERHYKVNIVNKRFQSARLVSQTVRKETPYVVKINTGNKIKDWFFNAAWKRFEKWGHVTQYFHDTTIETFDFTESKQKTIFNKILEELENRKYDHRENITPETHVIAMGEDTFFETVNEKRNQSPFFSDNMTFMSNDMYYNDPYNGRRVLNFSCHVIKGMQGFAFIPRVFIERKT